MLVHNCALLCAMQYTKLPHIPMLVLNSAQLFAQVCAILHDLPICCAEICTIEYTTVQMCAQAMGIGCNACALLCTQSCTCADKPKMIMAMDLWHVCAHLCTNIRHAGHDSAQL